MSFKRQKRSHGGGVIVRGAKRPTDKQIIVVNTAVNGTTQVDTVIIAALTRAVTLTGVRVLLTASAGSNNSVAVWALYVVPEGQGVSTTLSATTGAALIQPEQLCMAWGGFTILAANTGTLQMEANPKTGRKLKSGDRLVLSIKGTGTSNSPVVGAVQCFLRE